MDMCGFWQEIAGYVLIRLLFELAERQKTGKDSK